jgi:hypothetical protein
MKTEDLKITKREKGNPMKTEDLKITKREKFIRWFIRSLESEDESLKTEIARAIERKNLR